MAPNTITEGLSHLYQIKGIKLITATLLIFAHREFPQFPQVKIRNKTKCVNKATTKTRSVMHLNSNHTTGIPHQPKQWATDSRNLCLHLLTNTTKIIHGFRFLVILLTICDSVFSQQSNHHRRPFFDEGQLLIQGHTNDGFIDTLVTREIVKCLDAIRAEYPEVSEIKARHRYDLRTLMMELNDEANLILAKKIKPDTSAKLKNIPTRPYTEVEQLFRYLNLYVYI